MTKKFQKRVEDFLCEHCGAAVKGSGYTNHCPACLWSKHVDVFPGDRAEMCGGMMEPFKVEGGTDHYALLYRCLKCGIERKNKVQKGDDTEKILILARKTPQL